MAYVTTAQEAGVPVDAKGRAILAGQAGHLLDEGWPPEAIVRAVARFARRRRFAGHLAQWCRENAMDEREAEHHALKAADRATSKNTLSSIADQLKKAGLVA